MKPSQTKEQLAARVKELEAQVQRLEKQLREQPRLGHGDSELLGNLRLQTILDNLPSPILLKDKDLRFVAINNAFINQCGRPATSILGKTDTDIWPKALSPGFTDMDKEVIKTGKAVTVHELVAYGKNNVRMHETFKTPIFDDQGQVIGTAGIGHDISKLKDTEDQLTHVNDLLHELQVLSNTGGWEFDLATRKTYWTDNHARLYGYEPNEINRHFRFFINTIVHPDDVADVRACFRGALVAGERVDMTYRAVCKDGEIKLFKSVILPDHDETGQLRRLYGVALDVTPFHKTQEELLRAKDLAEQASRAKGEFLANMSHEIRTPLNGVLGMLQLLSQAQLGLEHDQNVQVAMDSGQGLLTIINDVLNLSKLEAGKAELKDRPFGMRNLVESLERLFQYPASKNRTQLHFVVDKNVPQNLSGDKERFRQILFNLIGNAIKFTEDGKITLTVSMLPLTCSPGHCQLLITLEDTGIGIAPEQIDFVLHPFSQVDGSLSRKYHGSGLGMHIVRRTVELMQGSMSIDSVPDQGTSIYLSLPFHPVRAGMIDEPEVEAPISTSPSDLRILVVEDERVNRLTATRFLEKLGHLPTMAHSGEEALEKLRISNFDAILMDIQMPGMDGLQTTKIIRTDESFMAHQATPIIALTAYAMEGDRDKFLNAGMDGYLSKPVDMNALRKVLGTIA